MRCVIYARFSSDGQRGESVEGQLRECKEYADGMTVKEISDELNSRGVFTNTKYKYTNKSSFHNLLKNRRYIGEYRYGDIITLVGMPARVPQDIFDRVSEKDGEESA